MISINDIHFIPIHYRKLINKLEQITNINFKFYRENFVAKRIKSRMIRLNIYDAKGYLDYILSHPEEIPKFLSGFTINTSYFFRNLEVYEKIGHILQEALKGKKTKFDTSLESHKNYFLNKKIQFYQRERTQNFLNRMSLVKKIKNKHINKSTIYVWSCACASGEEPYSLSILFESIKNSILNFPDYKIVASDIDKIALEKARIGMYLEESLKEVPAIYRLKHFKKIKHQLGDRYLLDEETKKRIDFIKEDVTKGHKKKYKYDIIFCRYFLIYTDKATRNEILNILYKNLAEGGLLILGKTETLFNSYEKLKLVDSKNHIYIKCSDDSINGR